MCRLAAGRRHRWLGCQSEHLQGGPQGDPAHLTQQACSTSQQLSSPASRSCSSTHLPQSTPTPEGWCPRRRWEPEGPAPPTAAHPPAAPPRSQAAAVPPPLRRRWVLPQNCAWLPERAQSRRRKTQCLHRVAAWCSRAGWLRKKAVPSASLVRRCQTGWQPGCACRHRCECRRGSADWGRAALGVCTRLVQQRANPPYTPAPSTPATSPQGSQERGADTHSGSMPTAFARLSSGLPPPPHHTRSSCTVDAWLAAAALCSGVLPAVSWGSGGIPPPGSGCCVASCSSPAASASRSPAAAAQCRPVPPSWLGLLRAHRSAKSCRA